MNEFSETSVQNMRDKNGDSLGFTEDEPLVIFRK